MFDCLQTLNVGGPHLMFELCFEWFW